MISFSEIKFFHESGKAEVFLPEQLEIIPILVNNEFCIKGETLLRRFNNVRLGILQAEYLVEKQDRIPAGWQEYHFPFPGTIYRHKRFRSLWIPYLIFSGYDKEWIVNFHCLNYYFNAEDVLLVEKRQITRLIGISMNSDKPFLFSNKISYFMI